MGKAKKILAGSLTAVLVVSGTAGALTYIKKNNVKEIPVTKVSGLTQSYYVPDTTLEGYITTSVTQNITVDKDMIIKEVFVSQGDSVSVGDRLIEFDMTLVQMELNIAKLKKQQQQADLTKARNRLTSLKNGGPIEEQSADNLNSPDSETGGSSPSGDMDELSGDDLAKADTSLNGNYLAASMAVPWLLLSADSEETILTDENGAETVFSEETGEENGQGQQENASDSGSEEIPSDNPPDQEGSDPIEDPGFEDPGYEDPEEQEPDMDYSGTDSAGGSEDNSFSDGFIDSAENLPSQTEEELDSVDDHEDGFFNGFPEFYRVLDYDSVPYTGTGTEEDPFVFMVSSSGGKVTARGSFLNKMAGYNEDGTQVLHKGGYWYLLEFHNGDMISDYQDRKASCIGYYLVDGSLLEKPVSPQSEVEFTLSEASQYEEPLPDDPGDFGGDPGGEEPADSTMTREEAIKLQESRISSLELDIQESDIEIAKLEKKLKREVIYSKLDGTVASVGDPLTAVSSGESFIRVKSKDGFYVRGTVGELLLDKMEPGTILKCSSYESGDFEAEVLEVSDYPVNSDSYYGDGNPNVSYYSFTASITDPSVKVSDQDWLTMTLQADASSDGSLVLSKGFVRTQNGVSYVYAQEDGVIRRRNVKVASTVDGGYDVLITEGLSRNDYIAFPYSKDIEEGMKTKEVSAEEMLGY